MCERIIKAKPISTNDREAISKATKIYFTDLGVRNSLINNFEDFDHRTDKGQLLENSVFVGIKKQDDYEGVRSTLGFFRSAFGSEIDIVRKLGSKEYLYEVKVSDKSNKKNIEMVTLKNAQKFLY